MSRTVLVLIICGGIVSLGLILVGPAAYMRWTGTALLSTQPAHGLAVVIESNSAGELDGVREVLRRRAASLGFRIYWEPTGSGQARILIPARSSKDTEWLNTVSGPLCRGGILQFRMVHPDSDSVRETGAAPAGYKIVTYEVVQPAGLKTKERLVLKAEPEPGLGGSLIKRAMVTRDTLGRPEILFELQPEAAAAFARVTAEHLHQRIAIVLDGQVVSAPRIQSPIGNGRGVISGEFGVREAVGLAAAMEAPLPVPVRVVETKLF